MPEEKSQTLAYVQTDLDDGTRTIRGYTDNSQRRELFFITMRNPPTDEENELLGKLLKSCLSAIKG